MIDALREIANPADVVRVVQERVIEFADDAHLILSKYESASKSRVISVDRSRRLLRDLSLSQDKLLEESLACIEHGLYRAAHVSAWQAFMDFLEEKLESDGLTQAKIHRPGWDWRRLKTMEDVRETFPEYQIIELARDVGLVRKNEAKSLHGMLSTRNDCAHPSAYQPDLSESLGYVSGLVNRMARLQPKTL